MESANKCFGEFFGVKENSGSYARDHLANERTYLAWIRTVMAVFGAGILILKFKIYNNSADIIVGTAICIVATLLFLIETYRYFENYKYLETGKFNPDRFLMSIAFILLLGIFIIIIILILIFST